MTSLPILIRRSTLDDAEDEPQYVAEAVSDYVIRMVEEGFWSLHELPQKAVQSHYANYYLAEINNGGHSQYVGNCGKLFRRNADWALAALKAMGDDIKAQIVQDMIVWVEHHPWEARCQTGFDNGRAQALEELDRRFDQAEQERSMQTLNAQWITAWPEVQAVENQDYEKQLGRLFERNPNRDARINQRKMRVYQTEIAVMEEKLLIQPKAGIGIAAQNVWPPVVPEFLEGREERYFKFKQDVDGESVDVFQIAADEKGFCFGCLTSRHAIYMDSEKRQFLVLRKDQDGLIALGRTLDAAVAVHLLLQRANIKTQGVNLALRRITYDTILCQQQLIIGVSVRKSIYEVRLWKGGGTLRSAQERTITAAINRQDLADFRSALKDIRS